MNLTLTNGLETLNGYFYLKKWAENDQTVFLRFVLESVQEISPFWDLFLMVSKLLSGSLCSFLELNLKNISLDYFFNRTLTKICLKCLFIS